jgi:hypothetical protein
LKDTAVKAVKMRKLREMIEIAESLDMPIHIGTEMNKLGQPIVDDLNVPELREYKEIFLKGARIVTGHAVLLRFAGYSYVGEAAEAQFGRDVKAKNAFFASVGALAGVNEELANRLREMGEEKALGVICESAKKQSWGNG